MSKIPKSFTTENPNNFEIPSVPVYTGADIPFVPRSNNTQNSKSNSTSNRAPNNLLMGGTTSPMDSVNNSIKRKYQVNAPQPQNTLTPCSVNDNKLFDPNSGNRRCYDIYSYGQNTFGKICTSTGIEGLTNGNADWFRGNDFGVNYQDEIVDDRVKYQRYVPSVKENNKVYITEDPFYPVPNSDREKNPFYKTYMRKSRYTKNGYPTWKYPYKINENFEDYMEKNINNKVIFWIGIFGLVVSLMLNVKKNSK